MVRCYFGNNNELSEKWMVRVMNFGQDRPTDVPQVNYKMKINANDLNEWSKMVMLEIKNDAQLFPDDWGTLGQFLQTNDGIDFTTLLKTDAIMAYQFAVDFAHDILLDVEQRYGLPFDQKPVYQLNTVEAIEIKEQTLLIQGKAFILETN